MIRTLQLYIYNTSTEVYDRVELFDDEEISITDSIKNSKDISKVFTTFSKQFTVPASKSNNKLFKHYYNFDILNGFDARKKVDARIELNHIPYKKGKIKLEGVDLKNNKPYAYRVTFFGSVVDLKDIVGEDKLPQLTDFQNVSKPYDIDSIISDLGQLNNDGIDLALITAGQRLYFDTGNSSKGSGNIYYDGTTAQGLKPQQLKYGIKLQKIVDAIESHYTGITFADNTFFSPSQSNDLNDLYMWLHRKNDTIEITSGSQEVIDGFNPSENINSKVLKVQSDTAGVLIDESTRTADVLTFETVVSSDTFNYDIVIYRDSGSGYVSFQEFTKVVGNKIMTINDPLVDGYKYKAYIKTYESNASFTTLTWKCTYSGATSGTDSFSVSNTTFDKHFTFGIDKNMPEMKVIDFLSGLFKMFNLVAYVDDDGKIVTKTLDEYYREGVEYDISQYVDVDSAQVDAALPFSEIFFKYQDTNTILAEQHLQEISNVEWGGVEYSNDESNLSGEIYKVEPPFNHSKFERLIDGSNTLNVTGVQVGYYVTDNEEAYLGQPLIYYIVPQDSGVRISYTRGDSLVNSPALTGTINMPSNSKTFDANISEENIHFNAELNEFTGTAFTDTLFERYYKKYIQNIFNTRNRLLKITAQLPVGITQKLTLADTLVINNRKFYINSMNINLSTGKAQLELINRYDVNAIWEQVEDLWSNVNTNWISV